MKRVENSVTKPVLVDLYDKCVIAERQTDLGDKQRKAIQKLRLALEAVIGINLGVER